MFANTGWRFTDDFVVGVTLGDSAQAYPFPTLRRQGVVNDAIGPYPIVLHTNAETRSVHVYLRKAGGQTLTFEADGERMRDKETGSLWSPVNGLAVSGPLQGELLQKVPSNSSYEWAWFDFYPHSTLYGE